MVLTSAKLCMLGDEALAEALLGDRENNKFHWDNKLGHHLLFALGRLLLMYKS
jgi:hypothetical protein